MTTPAESPATPLHVVATIPVRPDALDEGRDVLAELVAATREEEGCLTYDGFVSSEAGVLVTSETWRTEADLDAHLTTPHIGRAFERIGPLLAGEVVIHRLAPL